MLPDARSCRSASLRLIFLKNHLGTRGRVRAGGAQATFPHRRFRRCSWRLPPLLAQLLPGHRSHSTPTHGSGSRLFTMATKL